MFRQQMCCTNRSSASIKTKVYNSGSVECLGALLIHPRFSQPFYFPDGCTICKFPIPVQAKALSPAEETTSFSPGLTSYTATTNHWMYFACIGHTDDERTLFPSPSILSSGFCGSLGKQPALPVPHTHTHTHPGTCMRL